MGGFLSGLFGSKQDPVSANGPSLPYNTDELRQQLDFIRALQGNQGNLAGMLQTQAAGGGPNPALAQLNETTQQNAQQAAGMLAAQRGVNPALAAKMSSENLASANQNAVGQAAVLRAQQQLAAQKELGNLYGQMSTTGTTQEDLMNRARLGTQAINANISSGNAGAAGNAFGAGMQGLSSLGGLIGHMGGGGGGGGGDTGGISNTNAGGPTSPSAGSGDVGPSTNAVHQRRGDAMFAQGGTVPPVKMAEGGNPYDSLVASYTGLGTGVTDAGASSGGGKGSSILGGMPGLGGMSTSGLGEAGLGVVGILGAMSGGSKPTNPATTPGTGGNVHQPGDTSGGGAGGYAKGGKVMKSGGKVPGKAQVQGNSYANDVVDAKLSPGETVIDRETMQDKGEVGQAARFVAAYIAHRNARSGGKGKRG